MEIKWLKTFIKAAEEENFRKTAEVLFLSQPAITKHIKKLEQALQAELFTRNGRKVSLTLAGYRFLPHAKAIVFNYENGLDAFHSWQQGYSKKLTIACAPQLGASLLPPLLRRFIDKNPEVEVRIKVVNSYEISSEINDGKADLGLTKVKPSHPLINTELIHQEPVVLIGPMDTSTEPTEENMLLSYRILTHNHPDYWDPLLIKISSHYQNVKTMVVNQMEVTKRFIENQLGVSYLPLSLITNELQEQKLVKIAPDLIESPISSTFLLTKVETEEASLFRTFLKAELTNH